MSLAATSSRRGRFRLRPRERGGLRLIVRGAAYTALAASVVVPLLRKRHRLPPMATVMATASGPVATAVLNPRTKLRDAVLYLQQMWAFVMIHELPYDDPEALRRRLKIHYTIDADRAIGAGRLPNSRLQERFVRRDGSVGPLDRVLSFAHWVWFLEPHLSVLYVLLRDERQFARAARQMGAAFDLGCATYIAVPTAPPWWSAANGYTGDDRVERRMIAVGEETFGRAWPHLYDTVDGNPWAAMPSLHFGASVLAAILLGESSRTAGAIGWTYAGVLGFALVYLGEHYVVDLLAGLGLVATVRVGEPFAEPLALAISAGVQQLERIAAS